eukprot:5542573-Prymnesium_polylepis.1
MSNGHDSALLDDGSGRGATARAPLVGNTRPPRQKPHHKKKGTTGVDVVTIFARAIMDESRKECVNAGERLWTFGNGEEVHAIRVRVTGKTAWKVWYPKTSNNAATRV